MDKVYPIPYDRYKDREYITTQQVKSTIFPLYYERVDTYNEIYHNYE
jgi:hypothetical protein